MKRLFILHLLCLSISSVSHAQWTFQDSPYELDWKKESIIYGACGLGQLSSAIIESRLNPLTEEQIGLLDTRNVNSLDRIVIGYYSLQAQENSDILKYSAYAYPFLLLLDKKVRKDFLAIGVLAGEAYLVSVTLTSLTKRTAKRIRPLVYNSEVPLEKKTTISAKKSFFSGHTSTVATLSFFSAKVFQDYYPESKWKPLVWTSAAILPAATGYFRVRGGKHFPTDVIVGYVVGAIAGIGIPHIHKRKDKDQKVGFSISAGPTSAALTLVW